MKQVKHHQKKLQEIERRQMNQSTWPYNISVQMKFKTATLKLSLFDFNDAYIFIKAAVEITEKGADASLLAADRTDKNILFKNFALFTGCTTKISKS